MDKIAVRSLQYKEASPRLDTMRMQFETVIGEWDEKVAKRKKLASWQIATIADACVRLHNKLPSFTPQTIINFLKNNESDILRIQTIRGRVFKIVNWTTRAEKLYDNLQFLIRRNQMAREDAQDVLDAIGYVSLDILSKKAGRPKRTIEGVQHGEEWQ